MSNKTPPPRTPSSFSNKTTAAGELFDIRPLSEASAQGSPRASRPGEAFAPGSKLLGRYEILRAAGEGGMGKVYIGYDELLRREVAVKILHGYRGQPDAIREQLRKEAQAVASIQHPNVMEIYSIDLEHNPPFLVCEVLSGGSLSEKLKEVGRLEHQHAESIVQQLADGLDAIHQGNAVHGDIKPGNILFDQRGTPKLVDFGLAPYAFNLKPGEILGTPSYLSPERLVGTPATNFEDAADADRYAFYVTAYEMLTGELPYRAASPHELLAAQITGRMRPLSGLHAHFPKILDGLFERCLSTQTEDRPESAKAFSLELSRYLSGLRADGEAYRILLADDDDDCLHATVDLLCQAFPAARLIPCRNGNDVKTRLEKNQPHLCVVDMQMPSFDARQMVLDSQKHAEENGLPVPRWIVVSGVGGGRDWTQLRAVGVHRFFLKPVVGSELIHGIKEVLALPEEEADEIICDAG